MRQIEKSEDSLLSLIPDTTLIKVESESKNANYEKNEQYPPPDDFLKK